jgi:GT2 family glycosyltransferase
MTDSLQTDLSVIIINRNTAHLLLTSLEHIFRSDLELMKSDPSIGMVGPQLLNEDGSHQTSFEATPTLVTETLNRSLLKRLFPTRFPGKQLHVKKAFPVEALIGAVMMLRREYFDALGGFDEDYFFFLEETDLAVKMRQAGWQILHEPRAKAIHLQGATADIAPPSARIEFYRSRYIFFSKHYGSGATRVLKSVLTANLMLNVAGLGLIALATLGQARSVGNRLRVRTELLKWHLQGCPDGQGLPGK